MRIRGSDGESSGSLGPCTQRVVVVVITVAAVDPHLGLWSLITSAPVGQGLRGAEPPWPW